MASILLFIYRKEIPAYITATVGIISKWFPACSVPFFILYSLKNKRELRTVIPGAGISVAIIFLTFLPFVILDYQAFLKTYMFHIDRGAYITSMIYYLDVLSQYLVNIRPFASLSLVLLAIVEVSLLYWYFQYLDGNESTLCYVIFLSVFCFIVLNKVFASYYLIWITPFLALFFCNSLRQIVLFYLLQVITYLEIPVLMERVTQDYEFTGLSSITLSIDSFSFYSIKFFLYLLVLGVAVWNLWKMQGREADKRSAGNSD
jgi:hypothetical protein